MKNPWRLICLVLLAALVLIACSGGDQGNGSAPLYQDVSSQVTAYIEERMDLERVTGLSIALVEGQSLVWSGGFGLADAENRILVDENTVFEIGSLTKTITAAMIMRQVELGLMNLDDPLADYVPAWDITQRFEDSGPITIRTLLTHHAGIPGDILPGAFSLKFDPDAFTGWLMNELSKDYTTFPTNYRWAYSNSALVLAGQALANVCGRGLIQCGDRFLMDLGMSDSSFGPRPDLESRLSKGYYFDQEVGRYYCNISAAGGVWSTIGDMARYISFILGEGLDVLKPDSIRQMLTIQNGDVPLDPGMETGLTWLLSDIWAGLLASHTGGTAAHWCQVLILPEHDLGVVALTNSKNGLDLITQASYLCLELALKAKTGLTPPPSPQPVYSPPAQWTAGQLEAVAGIYSTGAGLDSFKPEGEGLSWSPYGLETTIFLIPRENGWFSPPEHQQLQLEFAEIAGRPVIVLHQVEDSTIYAQKYIPVPIDQNWSGRVGSYVLTNLPADDMSNFVPADLRLSAEQVELCLVDGLLILKTGTFGDQLIRPLDDSLAEIHGLGRVGGTIVRAGDNDLKYLGLIYKKEK